jgi:hypothetical protein
MWIPESVALVRKSEKSEMFSISEMSIIKGRLFFTLKTGR